MAWVYLVGAGILEVGWAIGLKYTEGFTKLWPSLWTVACMIVSFALLSLALRERPIGTAYAVWTGIGAVGTALVGMALLGEPRDVARLACILLIVVGIVGLKLTTANPRLPDGCCSCARFCRYTKRTILLRRQRDMDTARRYIPALSVNWLTPIYDDFLRRTMKEDIFKPQLIDQAQIQAHQRVLDLGCGTGTLAILIKQRHPTAEVTGLDADSRVLAMAEAKAEQAGVRIIWQQGMAYALPYEDGSFDRVVSTLVMHHLNTVEKRQTLQEVRRALKPGGELHIADFGAPHSRAMSVVAALLRYVEETADNFAGRLPAMMEEAGFVGVMEMSHFATIFGPMSLYRAATPAAQPRPARPQGTRTRPALVNARLHG